jgi:hypothetical protein
MTKMSHHETCGKCHTSGPCIHTVPKITQKDIEEAMEKSRVHFAKSPAERERERMEAKKPKARVGKCRVCGGVVTEEYKIQYEPFTMMTPIGGPPRAGWWASNGLSCQGCGIAYAKLPKE